MSKKYVKQTKKQSEEIINILIDTYKDAKCGLDYTTPFSLVVALILAAQCTDKRVNEVTPILFNKYPSIESIKNADITDIMNIVRPCGFTKGKSNSIVQSAKIVCDEFNGAVPDTMEDLTKLSGIGRKSANIILQECFGKVEGIAVDTHALRISNRLGLSKENDPSKVEQDLLKKIPKKYWVLVNHLLVYHGREICDARKPKCDICPVSAYCKYFKQNQKNPKIKIDA